jgi:hypothetical protein
MAAAPPKPDEELQLPPSENFGVVKEDEGPVIELGDRIRLSGGKYDKMTGRVIFRNENEIHLMPDGLTHTAIKLPITEEGFEEDSGIDGVEILQKRKKPALVDVLDLGVGQQLETFEEDGTSGPTFIIKKVDPEKDTIVVTNEESGDIDLAFGFQGVPDSLPFRVIRGRQAPEVPKIEENDENENENENGDNDKNEDDEGEEEEVELEDFTFLDDELDAAALQAPAEDEGNEYLVEIPKSERTYSNVTQKSEAYADLLSLSSPALQKLDLTQRNIRVLTEMFFQLRAQILRLSADGTPKGVKPTSIQTLIDALETRQIALSRCVVDVDKILYHDMDPETDPQPSTMDHLLIQGFNEKIAEAVTYIESSTDMAGEKYSQFLNSYLTRFGAVWRGASGPRIAFQRDEEAFRLKAPDADADAAVIPGFPQGLPSNKSGLISSEMIGEVGLSMIRGLKATRARGQVLQPGEEASVLAYVMFPIIYASSLSTLRQESLAADVKSGLKDALSMKTVLKRSGEITEIPSTNQPFLVSVEGGTLGNIPLREYLKALDLKAEGFGDIWPLQVLMGMREREWTIDQQEVLGEIITKTQNAMLEVILRQRENLAKQVSQPPAVQGIQMTPDGPQMIQKLADEPLIKDIQQAIKEQMPAFANSDVALVGLVLRHHSELAFAQLADQPAALTRMRMKYARDEYLQTIKNIQLKKQRIAFAGAPPEPVNCPHVRPLAMIRKVKDSNQRLALLTKFLTTFQGTKQDNWVNCRVGDHHLLCVHELLQVYQYLRPGDVSVLNKDIQLNFGGGQFQGYYICRNCGQPISELEYDTHLEFDDSGKPMMGRSELVDKDAVTLEEIDQIIGPMGDVEVPQEFDNETKTLIYMTAKQMADRVFAPLEKQDFLTLVARAFSVIQQIPTREQYIRIQQGMRKKSGIAAAAVAEAASALSSDYDVYINQALVCAVGVHLLLLVQSRKPDLILRGVATGCRSLRGQPLEAEGTQGIDCIVSVISSFQKDSPPWSLTQFQRERDDMMRQKMIKNIFEPILRSSLQDPTILQALAQKRDYKRKILGKAGGQGRPDEQLPVNFAPIPFQMKPEDFVEKIIIPEAATPLDRAELWVRQGNHLAKTNKLPKPMAFSETSCCLSPLNKIDDFWQKSSSSLPPFKKLVGLPPPPKITRTEPTMKPSLIFRPLPDAPENSYYLLFLKVCYDGEKKGQTHEFGLTHQCIWCGLKLPKELEILTAAQGRTAIEQQGIDVSKESFEALLNETHRVNSFKTKFLLELSGPLDNWAKLMTMDPEPAEGYREVMAKTQSELTKLPPDAKNEEVAVALSDFSQLAATMEAGFKARIANTQHALFDHIIEEGAESIVRFIQSYVIVPLKQFTSRRSQAPAIPKSWQLSRQHEQDVMNLLFEHRGYLTKFNKVITTPWLNAKIDTVLSQSRILLDALTALRPLQIPGGVQTYTYFLKFCLYAPLANFVDPNVLPIVSRSNDGEIEAPQSQVEQQALFPARFISEMSARFKGEGFHLTPERVRELIAERNEKEKSNIIKKMSDMSRAGKEIEMIKMKLGLGDWAVGGTKGVYAYDKERYDIERDQRAQAGIIDFPGQGPEGPGEGAPVQAVDGLGYYQTDGDEAGYIDDGELGDINGFDDDN